MSQGKILSSCLILLQICNVYFKQCGEEGHVSRDCPQGGGGGDSKCFKVNINCTFTKIVCVLAFIVSFP